MIFDKVDIKDPDINKQLKLKGDTYKASWQYYYECYQYASQVLLTSIKSSDTINPIGRAALFVIRHSLELNIKYNYIRSKVTPPHLHSFLKLFKYEDTPKGFYSDEFKNVISIINKDDDGACYRYILDYDQKYFFPSSTKEEIKNGQVFLHDFINADNDVKDNSKFAHSKLYSDFECKTNRDVIRFHTYLYEPSHLGQLRTQYDLLITTLLNEVVNNQIDINKLYLPILFLIRQSLELGLKGNIHEADKMSDYSAPQWFINSHSIRKVFNLFGGSKGYLKQLDLTKLDDNTLNKVNEKLKILQKLTDTINQLDSNSYYLRYPVNAAGKNHQLSIKHDSLINVLKDYYEIDSFLTFINAALQEAGILIDPPTPF